MSGGRSRLLPLPWHLRQAGEEGAAARLFAPRRSTCPQIDYLIFAQSAQQVGGAQNNGYVSLA